MKRYIHKINGVSRLLYFMVPRETENKIDAFSGAELNTHIRITFEAMGRFSEETGWEVSTHCTENIAQGAVVSDNIDNVKNHTLHCVDDDLAGCSYRLISLSRKQTRLPYKPIVYCVWDRLCILCRTFILIVTGLKSSSSQCFKKIH